MSLHQTNSIQYNKGNEVNFKDSEVKRFEARYPGASIVKDHYDSERELEDAWQKYSSLPYHMKVVSNEKALFLYGLKNEQLYQKQKKEFLSKDITSSNLVDDYYKPQNLKEDIDIDNLNNSAKQYLGDGGYGLIFMGIDDIHQLNHQWDQYNNQSHDQKIISNDKSLEIYGKTVPEMYQDELKRIMMHDIDHPSYDFLQNYTPTNTTLALENEASYHIYETKDLIEQAIILDKMSHRVQTPVHETIVDEARCSFKANMELAENIELFDVNFFLPEEIISIYEGEETKLLKDKNFLNYASRFYGIKPFQEKFSTEMRKILSSTESSDEKIKLGWNPMLEYNENNKKVSSFRSFKVINENINYKFISLEMTPEVFYENVSPKHGLSVITLHEVDKEIKPKEDTPRVLISFDYSNDHSWYPLMCSQFLTKTSLTEVFNKYSYPEINCFFIELNESVYNKNRELITRFNTEENKLTSFTKLLEQVCPEISSPKMFCVTLLESILHSNGLVNNNPSSVYHIYRDVDASHSDIVRAHEKVFIFEQYDKYSNSHYLQETFNLQIFNEVDTLPIEFDNDGNLFIKQKENIDFAAEYSKCHKLLMQYDKVKNYEAMKYYVSKLWYMNILIEEKLHRKNKSPELKEKLPYYYKTRAHILNDFNLYMGKILQDDPNFDFREYYANTPFDKSVLKISKNFMDRIWAGLKELLKIIVK